MNDLMGQLGAIRDLGALPADADLPAIIDELGLDQTPVDPTTLSAEELTAELQRVLKALLGTGARMPKSLMLFVKNLVFLDGAITTLAPDLDLLGEIASIAMYFSTRHGARIADEMGLGAGQWELDLTGVAATFGTDAAESGTITHRELRRRRQVIQERMEKAKPTRRRRRR